MERMPFNGLTKEQKIKLAKYHLNLQLIYQNYYRSILLHLN